MATDVGFTVFLNRRRNIFKTGFVPIVLNVTSE